MEASTPLFNRWLSIDPAKSALLIGPRRCGKTTLLRQRFPEHRYATLDDLDFLDWAVRDPKGFVSHLGPRCIIDEVQRSPKLTIAVKYAIDNEGAHVLMTGSSSLGLLDAAADSLAGRVRLYEMTPACWGEDRGAPTHEIFGALPDPPALKAAARELDEVLACGLFPEVLTTEGREARLALLNDYRNTYFMKDLLQMANLDNLEGLMAIYVNACRSLGSHLEVSHFAREAGLSFPTAKKYLNTLVQSQLAFRLTGYHFGPAKRIIKAAKTYFADNGIPASFRVRGPDPGELRHLRAREAPPHGPDPRRPTFLLQDHLRPRDRRGLRGRRRGPRHRDQVHPRPRPRRHRRPSRLRCRDGPSRPPLPLLPFSPRGGPLHPRRRPPPSGGLAHGRWVGTGGTGNLGLLHAPGSTSYFCFSGITPRTPPFGSCMSPWYRGIR
jgi:hypothetical protein